MTETLTEMHARHAAEMAAMTMPGAPTYAQLAAEVERLTNKTTDLRADLHRVRGERDHAKKRAEKEADAEVARLRSRVQELEGALRDLSGEIRIEVEARGGTKRQALARLELAECRARAVLSRSEGRAPEVKP